CLEGFSALLTLAHQQQWSSIVIGTGSKLGWGNPTPAPDLLISTQRLNRVLDHAVGDLTITVEAGATLAQVQTVLQAQQQWLPLDPAYPATATLGGIVATADAGSLRHRYSGVRDLILGIEVIRADGQRAKAGGRVVKNVAGYDLMKLFTGAYGTLGAIAQLTLRTYPLPPAETSVWITGKPEAIATLSQQIRGSSLTPIAMDLLSTRIVAQIEAEQFGQTASGLGLLLKFATLPESITAQIETITAWVKTLGLKQMVLPEQESPAGWEAIAPLVLDGGSKPPIQNPPDICHTDTLNFRPAVLVRQPQTPDAVTLKLGVLPTAAVDLLTQLPPDAYGRIYAGSGVSHIHFPTAPTATDLKRLRRLCEQNQGYLSILDGPDSLKAEVEPWGYPGNALWLMQRLKAKFDPNNLLHPGCFVGGI
ncbi:MAG: FAD-binding oxidoreductase, partial [Spirulina sp. SIO3F2]|nr:FAD-binding oxidoreductase [Spirulina sp. SIO3F2]